MLTAMSSLLALVDMTEDNRTGSTSTVTPTVAYNVNGHGKLSIEKSSELVNICIYILC